MLDPSDVSVPGAVPDLRKKVRYLLKVRGGKFMDGGPKPRAVALQRTLAHALGIDPSRIAEWNRYQVIPNLAAMAPRIADIFACDERSFRLDSYAKFVEKLENRDIGWDAIVAAADVVGMIEEFSPAPRLRFRQVLPTDVELEDEDLPVLHPGALISVHLPISELLSGAAVSKTYVVLFSLDASGYLNWTPRFEHSAAFNGIGEIVGRPTHINLPAPGGELKIGRRDRGDHAIVLVASAEPLPDHLQDHLRRPLEGADLTESLAAFARWLAPRLLDCRATIGRRPYFVQA